MRITLTALSVCLAFPALAGGPLPSSLPIDGPKSQVVNVGSVHMSEFKQWTPAMVEPLIVKLTAFRPEVVTIENIDGEQCEMLRSAAARYRDAKDYCWDPAEIRGATGLTVGAALDKVQETLAAWPKAPSAARRRQLAMLFLAAGDRPSARVQWLRLPLAERRPGDGLDAKMIEIFLRNGKAMNESYDVAAEVAARSGLERVHQVDDHSSDGALVGVGKGYGEALGKHFQTAVTSPIFLDYKARTSAIKDGAGLLSYYRDVNSPGAMTPQVSADFGGAMAQVTPEHFGRMYLGWWEVRNLRMVANIRASFVAKPGARVLNIVGASHKPWYDALLGQMADVEIVDAAHVLR